MYESEENFDLQEKKNLFYLEGLGNGIYQVIDENLGSFQDKIFKRLIIYKYEESDSNSLIDYFEINYTHHTLVNSIELTCNFFLESILNEEDVNLTSKIIYCKTDEKNIQKEFFWSENNKLPYMSSFNYKLDICIPKVFNKIYMCDLGFLIRKKQTYFF